MIKAIAKLIFALNGNVKKSQIAAGFAWGVFLGLVPAGNLFWIVLFLISFFFRHNHWSKILFMLVLQLLSPVLAPLVDIAGWWVLHIDALQPLYTSLYNMPFVPFTRFYNTLVAGGLVSGIILFVPVFLLFMALIGLYRNTIAVKIRNSKLVKTIAKFPIFSLLDKSLNGV
jgi:uncharacterized protein (TIGR03546 family)